VSPRAELREIFAAALATADGAGAVERALERLEPPFAQGDLALVAVGKAACPMAEGALRALGHRITRTEIATKQGHGFAVGDWPWAEAAHPVPDARSAAAAERALALVRALPAGMPLLVLLSGGASALWAAPAAGISLAEKQITTQGLLRSGAEIRAINAVRKHLSRIKGGQLAREAGERPLLTLAISDVAGDVPDAIGSGPTVADPTRFADAWAVLRGSGLESAVPAAVREHLDLGSRGERAETAKPGARCFARASYRVVASLGDVLEAAVRAGELHGLRVRSLGASLYGEARELAAGLAAAARTARAEGIELLIAGGEPTVTVRGSGQGGRAQELALALALEMAGEHGLTALVAGTDGSDGPTAAAGAFADGRLVDRARALEIDPRAALVSNDSHSLLARTGDVFVTGPTRTNVNDLALIRLQPAH
jgi:glycerate-2-kinase